MSLHSKITVTNLQQMELPDPVAIISVKPEDMVSCVFHHTLQRAHQV